jgi:hypothetical protein
VANPHNCINDVPLAVGTPIVVDGLVVVYLGCYDLLVFWPHFVFGQNHLYV